MADINIDIGARNMARQAIVETRRHTREMTKDLKKLEKQSKETNEKMTFSFRKMAKGAAGVVAIIASIKTAMAGMRFANESIDAFNVQQKAAEELNTALKINGEFSEAAAAEARKFAAALQETANVGDEVTLGLMRRASILGVEVDRLDDFSLAAVGLSKALGIDLETALKRVQGATGGVFGELGEMIPALRNAGSQSEKMAILQEVAAKGLKLAAAETNTLRGQMTRAENSMGDLKEVVGSIIEPFKMLSAQGVAVFAETLQSALVPQVKSAKSLMENIAPIMERVRVVAAAVAQVVKVGFAAMSAIVKTTVQAFANMFGLVGQNAEGFTGMIRGIATHVISTMTFIETALTNFGDVWAIAVDSASLQVIALVENVKHWWSNVLPTVMRNHFTILFEMAQQGWNAVVGSIVPILKIYVRTINSAMLEATKVFLQSMAKLMDMTAGLMDRLAKFDPTGVAQEMADNLRGNSDRFEGWADSVQGSIDRTQLGIQAAASQLKDAWSFEMPTMEPLPGDREITEDEKRLKAKIGSSAQALADVFKSKMKGRLDGLDDALAEGGIQNLSNLKLDFDLGADKSAEALTKATEASQKLTVSQGRLLSGSAGSTDPAKLALEEAKRQTELQKRADEALKKIVEQTKVTPELEQFVMDFSPGLV